MYRDIKRFVQGIYMTLTIAYLQKLGITPPPPTENTRAFNGIGPVPLNGAGLERIKSCILATLATDRIKLDLWTQRTYDSWRENEVTLGGLAIKSRLSPTIELELLLRILTIPRTW